VEVGNTGFDQDKLVEDLDLGTAAFLPAHGLVGLARGFPWDDSAAVDGRDCYPVVLADKVGCCCLPKEHCSSCLTT